MIQKGLGRGLQSLLNDNDALDVGAQSQDVDINLIFANPHQPRKSFDADALGELAQSITTHGLINPIVVVRSSQRFMIIAGERRYKACKLAGLSQIPVIIKDYTSRQIKEVSLIDNLQREDLNPIDTAIALDELIKEYSYTQEQLSERVGKSRSQVANLLRLLSLDSAVRELVATHRLSAGHARCLVVITDKVLQLRLAQMGMDNKLTVRDFENLIRLQKSTPTVSTPKNIEMKDLAVRLKRIFATKVVVSGTQNKGKITVDYFTKDDLDRIVYMLESLA